MRHSNATLKIFRYNDTFFYLKYFKSVTQFTLLILSNQVEKTKLVAVIKDAQDILKYLQIAFEKLWQLSYVIFEKFWTQRCKQFNLICNLINYEKLIS
jgi:hypothetical protein